MNGHHLSLDYNQARGSVKKSLNQKASVECPIGPEASEKKGFGENDVRLVPGSGQETDFVLFLADQKSIFKLAMK